MNDETSDAFSAPTTTQTHKRLRRERQTYIGCIGTVGTRGNGEGRGQVHFLERQKLVDGVVAHDAVGENVHVLVGVRIARREVVQLIRHGDDVVLQQREMLQAIVQPTQLQVLHCVSLVIRLRV